jgi:hypothetical protein
MLLRLEVKEWCQVIHLSRILLSKRWSEVTNGNTALHSVRLSEIIVEKVINLNLTHNSTNEIVFLTFSSLTISKIGRPSDFFWEAGLFCSFKMKLRSYVFFLSGITGLHWSVNITKGQIHLIHNHILILITYHLCRYISVSEPHFFHHPLQ